MEKVGVDKSSLLTGLLDDEANLMQEMQSFMSMGEKTASEQQKEDSVNNKLSAVRSKISEIEVGANKATTNG